MKKTRAVKIILWAVIIAAAAAGVWLMVKPSGSGDITLQTAQAVRGDIRNSVTATGTVEPVTLVEVGTQVSGIIDRLYVDYNDRVTARSCTTRNWSVTPSTTRPSISTRRPKTPTPSVRPPSSASGAIWATPPSPRLSTEWSSAGQWRRARQWPPVSRLRLCLR